MRTENITTSHKHCTWLHYCWDSHKAGCNYSRTWNLILSFDSSSLPQCCSSPPHWSYAQFIARNCQAYHRSVEEERFIVEQIPWNSGRMCLMCKITLWCGMPSFNDWIWIFWVYCRSVAELELVFSVVTLKGIIPSPDLQCWQLFVRTCSILCSKCWLLKEMLTWLINTW